MWGRSEGNRGARLEGRDGGGGDRQARTTPGTWGYYLRPALIPAPRTWGLNPPGALHIHTYNLTPSQLTHPHQHWRSLQAGPTSALPSTHFPTRTRKSFVFPVSCRVPGTWWFVLNNQLSSEWMNLLIHVWKKKKKNRALLQPGKSEPRPWPEKEGFYFQIQHISLSLDVFKKRRRKKRNQKRKEEKLTS